MLQTPSKIRINFRVQPEELALIKSYLQGAVYSWIKDHPDDFFAARDLVGGLNKEWHGTPLDCLYWKHKNTGKTHEKSMFCAGIDLGWILKTVLSEDKRKFSSRSVGRAKGYKWVR